MKIICTQSDLQQKVRTVSRAVAVHSTIPIMECILITAYDDEIRMTANNKELGIETIVPGRVLDQGDVALDAKVFSDIISKLPQSDVHITTDDNFVTFINCENSSFNISGRSGEDFAYLPQIENDNYISISEFALKQIIQKTIFAISSNESNITLTGELFEVHEDQLRIIALDGHRVSIRYEKLKDSYGDERVIVPGKTLNDLTKILEGDAEKEVNIYFTKNHVSFNFRDTLVISRLIEGKFIDVMRMVTDDYETKVTVNKADLYSCIDRSTLLSKENDRKPIVMHITDEYMTIDMKSSLGSMREEISVVKEGKDLTIGFNPKFFTDALREIEDEEVSLYMINYKCPCFIKNEEGTYIYMILPVNM